MRLKLLSSLLPAGAGLGMLIASCTNGTIAPVVACGPDNVATTAYDVSFVTTYESGFYYAAVDPVAATYYAFTALHPDAAPTQESVAAASAAAAAAGNYYASGCFVATANQNVVTYVLTNCTGLSGWLAPAGRSLRRSPHLATARFSRRDC